eukprot:8323668-Pyramimonas_sp.AAC.1
MGNANGHRDRARRDSRRRDDRDAHGATFATRVGGYYRRHFGDNDPLENLQSVAHLERAVPG